MIKQTLNCPPNIAILQYCIKLSKGLIYRNISTKIFDHQQQKLMEEYQERIMTLKLIKGVHPLVYLMPWLSQ